MAMPPTTMEEGMSTTPPKEYEPGKSTEDEIEGQLEDVDPIAEARLVRKLDLHIIPVVMLLYLFSFLDR